MEPIKVIITGTTGMVGEGVMLESLNDPRIAEVLSVSRKSCGVKHPKLKEYIVTDFLALQANDATLNGYDACFFCAGISSVGMSEADYTRITYDTTLHFGKVLSSGNPKMTFIYVSGASTDGSEKGRVMWARVKGRTENDLQKLSFRKVYNFRPGFMKAVPGQQHTLKLYKYISWVYPVLKTLFPNSASTLHQVANAMIICATTDVQKPILEVKDINSI